MNLHSSQTASVPLGAGAQFETPMNLHSSQTKTVTLAEGAKFETPMNLHSSQTLFKHGNDEV